MVQAVLRLATAADLDFLFAVYASTRMHELEAVGWPPGEINAFLRMQFDAQRRHYAAVFPDARLEIIEVDGVPVGQRCVHESEREFRLVDLALLPAWRRRGIGEACVQALLGEARRLGKDVALHVLRDNPAQALYARLGFKRMEEAGLYCGMRWSPGR